ncbi:ceramide synthase 1-like [Rhopilema esculentum]|uniref:ceramide synthase 1-like n=1 Tax=Rhopilema esculentum TaxID=499914 RepID=UPI0031D7F16D|eukprot:gene17216-8765_t
MVGYSEVFNLIWKTCQKEWVDNKHPKGFFQEMADNICLEKMDFVRFIAIAIIITFIRKGVAKYFLQPLAEKLNFDIKDRANFPECTFKFIVYLLLYATECVVLLSTYKEFLTDPRAPWKGWQVGMSVSPDLYWIYAAETGFYIHGIYGTIFMDIWRDDSVMLLLHHVLTISLIVFSLGLRYHKIGLVVLFLHDIADVFLEFTKIIKCFQNREKSKKSIYSIITSLGFVFFASAWIGCRIFIYPLIVLYSTGYEARNELPDAPFYFFFNGLLWILFCMNVWWSYFIILLIFRIIVGKSKSIEDTRELYVTEEQLLNSKKKDSLGETGEANANEGEQKEAMTNGSFQNGVTQNGVAHKHHNGAQKQENGVRKRN